MWGTAEANARGERPASGGDADEKGNFYASSRLCWDATTLSVKAGDGDLWSS